MQRAEGLSTEGAGAVRALLSGWQGYCTLRKGGGGGRDVLEERRKGGSGTQKFVPKVCVPRMARQDFPNGKFRFFARWSLWSGGEGVSRSNTSLGEGRGHADHFVGHSQPNAHVGGQAQGMYLSFAVGPKP